MPGSATAETLFGVESATFRWDPATGPVTSYRIFVSTDGGPSKRYGTVSGTEAVVQAKYGQTISVSVTAISRSAGLVIQGSRSEPSDEVLFLAEPQPEPIEVQVLACREAAA